MANLLGMFRSMAGPDPFDAKLNERLPAIFNSIVGEVSAEAQPAAESIRDYLGKLSDPEIAAIQSSLSEKKGLPEVVFTEINRLIDGHLGFGWDSHDRRTLKAKAQERMMQMVVGVFPGLIQDEMENRRSSGEADIRKVVGGNYAS